MTDDQKKLVELAQERGELLPPDLTDQELRDWILRKLATKNDVN